MKQTIVKVDNEKWGHTFITFYGKDIKKQAKQAIKALKKQGVKAQII